MCSVRKIFIFIASVVFSHTLLAGGTIIINERFDNLALRDALEVLKENYHLKIAFAERNVEGISVSAVIDHLNVHDAFQELLRGTPLTFELVGANAVIIKKKKVNEDLLAGQFEVSGVVKDVETGESLPYAYIWIESDGRSLITNVEGYFAVSAAGDSTRLKISYLGYRDTTVFVTNESKTRRLYVQLTPQSTELEAMVVVDKEGQTNDFKYGDQPGKTTMNPAIARKLPTVGEVDIFRSLQLLPGINATNEVSSGLRVSGGASNQSLVLFDGFTVYHIDHFFGYFSAFNPLAIKSLQLYKGGFEAKYGGRASSVIDITGKDGNRNQTSGTLGLNLLSVNTSLEVPLSEDGATLFFSGRRSYTDIWGSSLFERIFSIFESNLTGESRLADPMAPRAQGVRSSVTPDFYYTDMNFKFSSRLGPKNHLSLSFYDSNDILNYTQNVQADFGDTLSVNTENLGVITWGNVGTSLKFSRQWNTRHYSNALISWSFYESNFREQSTSTDSSASGEFTSATTQRQNNNIEDLSFKYDHDWEIGASSRIETGLAASIYSTQLGYQVDDSMMVDELVEDQFLLACYLQGTFTTRSGFAFTPGLRSSYLAITDRFYLDPRLSFSYKPGSRWVVSGATGIYHQFVNQSNTRNVLEGSRDFWILANGREVPVQRAWHGLLGVQYRHHQSTLSVSYFQKNFAGLMEYTFKNGHLLTEFDDPGRVFAVGEGKARGIEVLWKRDIGRFISSLAYTLGEVQYTFTQINEGRTYHADYDQRHELNWYGLYTIGRFEFSATWIYGSGMPYSEVTGLRPPSGRRGDGPQASRLQLEEKNGERLPAYHRMDVSAGYHFYLGKVRAELAASLFNVYNHKNVLDKKVTVVAPGGHMGPMRRRDPVIAMTDVQLMGITPNVSMMIHF